MKILKLACSALTLILSVAFAGPALATTVIPLSYTFDQPTSCGTWCYHDPAFTKLTDGVVGLAGWAVNAGQEWDGWLYKPVVNIDFDFGAIIHIGSVKIGTTQDSVGNVAFPSFDLYKKVAGNWVLEGTVNIPPSSANNISPNSTAPHGWVTFDNLDIDSQFLRVTAHANSPWLFVDEVQFDGAVVSEPGTYAILLLGLGLMGLTAGKRKKCLVNKICESFTARESVLTNGSTLNSCIA